MIEVKVDTATPRSPSSSTNCEKGSTMIGQRTRPHPLDGPAKRGLRNVLDRLLESDVQVSTAVAQALVEPLPESAREQTPVTCGSTSSTATS